MGSHSYKFKPGDIVSKLNGYVQAEVLRLPSGNPVASGWNSYHAEYFCRYLSTGRTFRDVESNLRLVTPAPQTAPVSKMKTLYSFAKSDGTVGYGTYLATNSSNQLVVEEKGTGAILTFDKDQLTEVLPYTFSIVINGKETHYLGDSKMSLKKGDLVLTTDAGTPQLGKVSGTDTKNRTPREKFNGVKIVTEAI